MEDPMGGSWTWWWLLGGPRHVHPMARPPARRREDRPSRRRASRPRRGDR
ncbi:hypothetical protein AGRA3207_006688 [Actinomadura graeca]|uniref:Uncharacterized protein n=1 Tax=Actinomadura graeca TaxID=2750812 RepID=A0ABX8R2F3_9ACTN|nr:hypothetical protein [Actinomadura graeca]QXJ25220.1 hypothetical protein AGRA3207_006688 [Actinomadura graeca]